MGEYPGLRWFFKPVQIGSDSDWARMLQEEPDLYVWKQNGDDCVFSHQKGTRWKVLSDPAANHLKVKSSTPWGPPMWILDDGTLWLHQPTFPSPVASNPNKSATTPPPTELRQIGTDSDWAQITAGWQLLGLKTDGTLWKWKPFVEGEESI